MRKTDLHVSRGEVLGLIGESGAGKSTLAMAAIGYVRPGLHIAGGTIQFDGISLSDLPDSARRALWGRQIAYVAQSASAALNPARRLINQCIEPIQIHGLMPEKQARARIIDLFARLLLPQPDRIAERYPHQVSGGQLQRVLTAMAMSCHPSLVVFDEPTTALDVTTQLEVLGAIRSAVRGLGMAAIYISHDLAVVAQMADRIMVMRDGECVESAATRTMLAAPQNDYTKSLWAVRTMNKPEQSGDFALLDVRDLSAGYGSGPDVVKSVSLQVKRARTVAVVGESGSGKSSLARAIVGLLPPRNGTVSFAGRIQPPKLASRSQDIRRQVQLVHQTPDTALNPRKTVSDILGRSLALYGYGGARACRHRAADLLAMTELSAELLDRTPTRLSGGQKQRVCIARALAAEPQLMICDEITSGLDQLVAEQILQLLLRLQCELNISYLFITHDLAVVRAVADSVLVMRHGEVVDSGPKSKILKPGGHAYTDALLASVPQMEPNWLDAALAKRERTS